MDEEFLGKWYVYGSMHLKVEHWSKQNHSLPKVISCHGGWILFKNLPLHFWKNSIFEAIGPHLGGFVEISSQTLNCLECLKVVIRVEKNICGFISDSLTIEDSLLGKFAISFEVFEPLIPQDNVSHTKGCFMARAFSNFLDLSRIKKAMTDEGFSVDNIGTINNERLNISLAMTFILR